jgi:hypothetical protein
LLAKAWDREATSDIIFEKVPELTLAFVITALLYVPEITLRLLADRFDNVPVML